MTDLRIEFGRNGPLLSRGRARAGIWVGSKCWSLHRSLKPRDVGSIPTQPTKSLRTRSGADAGSTTKVSSETAMQMKVSGSTHQCATLDRGVQLPSSAPCVDFTRVPPSPGCSSSERVPRERATQLDFTRYPSSCSWIDTRSNARATHLLLRGSGRPAQAPGFHPVQTSSTLVVRTNASLAQLEAAAAWYAAGRRFEPGGRHCTVSPLKLSWL